MRTYIHVCIFLNIYRREGYCDGTSQKDEMQPVSDTLFSVGLTGFIENLRRGKL